jgi:hypothetical protein
MISIKNGRQPGRRKNGRRPKKNNNCKTPQKNEKNGRKPQAQLNKSTLMAVT